MFKCRQSGDNWRCVYGGEWSTDCLRASCTRNVASCTGTSGIRQTSCHSAPASEEHSTPHWTALWFASFQILISVKFWKDNGVAVGLMKPILQFLWRISALQSFLYTKWSKKCTWFNTSSFCNRLHQNHAVFIKMLRKRALFNNQCKMCISWLNIFD